MPLPFHYLRRGLSKVPVRLLPPLLLGEHSRYLRNHLQLFSLQSLDVRPQSSRAIFEAELCVEPLSKEMRKIVKLVLQIQIGTGHLDVYMLQVGCLKQ